MTGAEGVVFAFKSIAKPAYAVGLPQPLKFLVVSAGKELVRIALVGYVEKYLVFWR